MNILVYDIENSGHHIEYLSHLINYIVNEKLDGNYIFIVHPRFSIDYPKIVDKGSEANNIIFKEVSEKELRLSQNGNVCLRSFRSYKLMKKYALANNANKVILMSLNLFQLALIFERAEFQIKGILFRPFFRMEKKTWLTKLKYYRKILQTELLVKNKNIGQVFILNDLGTVNFMNKTFSTNIFQLLPDPVPSIVSDSNLDIRKNYDITSNCKIFLHFGSLSERKGTLKIIDAIKFLDKKVLSTIAILLIGKASKKIDLIIQEKISMIKKEYPQAIIIYKNEFISDSNMKAHFEQCDVVLIPYQNVEASSGVLGHAISFKKPVIATNKGLLGLLVGEYKLGILLNIPNSEEIAYAIRIASSKTLNDINNRKYLCEHTPARFAKTILE